jgi:hypothetical protein
MGRSFRVITAVLLGLATAAAPAAAADAPPDQLLKEYPLEQRPATVANAPARTSAESPPAAAPGSTSDDAPRFSQGAAIGIACAAMLLAGLVVVRRRRDVRPAHAGASAGTASPGEEQLVAPVPADDAEPEAPPPPAPPVRAARQGVHCQIRWDCDGDVSWFSAVTTKDRDHETVAESPEFAWTGPEPPPRTPDTHWALQDLVAELEAAGWQLIRGRGRQDGAPRWYARRFLLPFPEPEPLATDEPTPPTEAGIG